MSSRDFCYWLRGYFETNPAGAGLKAAQVEVLRRRLAEVFAGEADPATGTEDLARHFEALRNAAPECGLFVPADFPCPAPSAQ